MSDTVSAGQVRVARDGHVATITLDNPAKRNALTYDAYGALGAAVAALDRDDDVRCVVVRGAAGNFCAGSDIGDFGATRMGVEQARRYADFTIEMIRRLRDTRHPTVAVIEGFCLGGGLEIAAVCDIRIAARTARFGMPANRIGVTLDYAELADLMAVVGPNAVAEIVLEGRIFDAVEAAAKGLVSRVVDDASLESEAADAARRIALAAPLVNRWHKKFIRRLADTAPLTPAERDEPYACFATEDYEIGRTSFARKEKPRFVGR
jgi:enoyl-CoA hydratase/carnithine racemase